MRWVISGWWAGAARCSGVGMLLSVRASAWVNAHHIEAMLPRLRRAGR